MPNKIRLTSKARCKLSIEYFIVIHTALQNPARPNNPNCTPMDKSSLKGDDISSARYVKWESGYVRK